MFLNDHLWKYEYSNLLTGKLSDFIGLFILPIFLTLIFPKYPLRLIFATAILFIGFKMPIADIFIDTFNSVMPYSIQRTIDYSDFIALSILPVSYIMINKYDGPSILKIKAKNVELACYLFLSVTFLSTSKQSPRYPKEGNLNFSLTYNFDLLENDILDSISARGFEIFVDSAYINHEGISYSSLYYSTNTKILELAYLNQIDSIARINFNIKEDYVKKKSNLIILNVEINNGWKLQDINEMKRIKKAIKKLLEKEFIDFRK